MSDVVPAVEAVADPAWTMFCYPRKGPIKAAVLMRGNTVHFQFFGGQPPAWFVEMSGSFHALEAFLAEKCGYVPRQVRAVVWGLESVDELEARLLSTVQ